MPYVEDHLNPGEEIVHTTTLHPFIFVNGGLLAILALLLTSSSAEAAPIGWFLLLVPLVVLGGTWVRYTTSEFAVTTSRVVIKTGWLSRATLELQLAKVEAVAVHQGIIGRAFDFGTLIVAGTGGTKERFTFIKKPIAFRKVVQRQIEAQSRSLPIQAERDPSGPATIRDERECPHCAERILAKAVRCRFCGQPVAPLGL